MNQTISMVSNIKTKNAGKGMKRKRNSQKKQKCFI